MDITFEDLVKYAKIKNVNGTDLKELLANKSLIYKVEELRNNDSHIDEVVNRLQNCYFSNIELTEIEDLYEKYFGPDVKKAPEEDIAEKFGVALDNIEIVNLDNGEEAYKFVSLNNRDIVLKKDDNKEVDEAKEVSKLNGYKELKFYTKEELNNRLDLLNDLSLEQIEKIRSLTKNKNVEVINPEFGLALDDDHKLITATYDKENGVVNVVDEGQEILDEIEDLELDTANANVAEEKDYANLVTTTQLPVVELEEYTNILDSDEPVEELEEKPKQFVKDSNGYVVVAYLSLLITCIVAIAMLLNLFF